MCFSVVSLVLFVGFAFLFVGTSVAERRSRWRVKEQPKTTFIQTQLPSYSMPMEEVQINPRKRRRWANVKGIPAQKRKSVNRPATVEYFKEGGSETARALSDSEYRAKNIYREAEGAIGQVKENWKRTKESIQSEAQQRTVELQQQVQRQMQEQLAKKMDTLSAETQKQMDAIQRDARARALRLIADVESKKLREYLGAEKEQVSGSHYNSLYPQTGNKVAVSTEWKEKIKSEFDESIRYLKEIVEADEQSDELSSMLDKKKLSFDQTLSNTQVIGDAPYQETVREKEIIERIKGVQIRAEVMLKEAFGKMEISESMQKKARLYVLFELNALVQEKLNSSQSLSDEEINAITIRSIEKAKQNIGQVASEKTETKLESAKPEDEEKEQLKEKLDVLKGEMEKQKEETEKKTEELSEEKEKLEEEKQELQEEGEETKKELEQAKLDLQKLPELQKDMEKLNSDLDGRNTKIVVLEGSLEQAKQGFEIAKDREEQIKDLHSKMEDKNKQVLEFAVMLERSKTDLKYATHSAKDALGMKKQLNVMKTDLAKQRSENLDLEIQIEKVKIEKEMVASSGNKSEKTFIALQNKEDRLMKRIGELRFAVENKNKECLELELLAGKVNESGRIKKLRDTFYKKQIKSLGDKLKS